MNKIVKVLAPLIVLAMGVAVLLGLVMTKPKAKEKPKDERGELVEVAVLKAATERVEVVARGTVVPARQVILSPEVGGRIVSMSESFVPGGILSRGDTALRVDARDYRLALEQQYAAVNRAETELAIEESRKSVAEKEWEKFGSKRGGTASSLAKREPQLKSAQVAVKSAQSGVRQAKLRVSRTTIKAPFNGIIQQRNVNMGQVVAPGTPVATLVGIDAYWVQVSVPMSQLAWFAIPGIGGSDHGAEVEVRQKIGAATQIRKGRVVRLLGDVDPAGRMARVLVEIPNPLESTGVVVLASESDFKGAALPLLLGSYVEVAITARVVEHVFTVPRVAIHDGDKVYLMKKDGTLEIRQVDVVWSRPESVLITQGLENGESLVTTPIPAPVAKMKLRLVGAEPATKPSSDRKDKPLDDGKPPPDETKPAAGETKPAAGATPAAKTASPVGAKATAPRTSSP